MLAVIGSTGKNEDGENISHQMYENAYEALIDTMYEINDFDLVSRGCAFSDHLAIRAFNEGIAKSLVLFLPAEIENNKFKNTKYGKVANHHHDNFEKVCDINSFEEMKEAYEKGAELFYCDDFIDSNNKVIDCSDKLIAFTLTPNVVVNDYLDNRHKVTFKSYNVNDAWQKANKFKFRRHIGYNGMRGFNE